MACYTDRFKNRYQEQGGTVISPGNGFPFRRLLRLAQGRAVAQAVSRRLLTAAARVQTRV
jgi:hypothetical protein